MSTPSHVRVAYLGPEGTYTEQVARQRFADGELVACASIEQVFAAVADGDAEQGVVPIENMLQGPVTETQDGLYRFNHAVRIQDMRLLAIEHALGSTGDLGDITRIYSKDQALKQCSDYLQAHFPEAKCIEVDSTSEAARRVAASQDPTQAAIASSAALARFGLTCQAEHIGNVRDNKTRFAVLGSTDERQLQPTGSDATAFAIYPPGDRVGILEEILAVISRDHGLSLSSIHSRPDRRGAFRFYMELEGHLHDPIVTACLDSLRRKLADDLAEILVFGSYPRCPFNAPQLKTVGIVGGAGRMGQWFQRFFEQAGFEVLVSGLEEGLPLGECIERSQAILISVPITQSVAVAAQVGGLLKPGQLVLDNTSVKGEVMDALMTSVADGVEVLGMHTIFGPSVDTLRKQNTVFTRTVKSGELASEFENVFYKYGARLSFTDETNHDQQMAFHQNLEHFTKLVLAEVLSNHVSEPSSTIAYSSPNSRASLRTMARVLQVDTGLLTDIQTHNSQGAAMIGHFMRVAKELQALIERGEFGEFRARIERSLEALGPELLEQLKRSED